MKKIAKFFKWPFSYPLSFFALLYLYWFLFSPMEFSHNDNNYNSLFLGLLLISIYFFFIVILYLSKSHTVLFSLCFLISLIFLLINTIYYLYCSPKEIDRAELGNYRYYIISTTYGKFQKTESFYKCEKWSFNCDFLFGSNTLTGARIIVDEKMNEVSLFEIGFSRLRYTDGENPRGYTGFESILQDRIYMLSDKCIHENKNLGYCATIYILYSCNLGYTECLPLPIRYTSIFAENLVLEADEIGNKVNLYDDFQDNPERELIFSYGENPKCYVEGCEILEP